MRNLLLTTVAVAALVMAFDNQAQAQNCNYSWQRASDGSLCGGRAAEARPGGALGGGGGFYAPNSRSPNAGSQFNHPQYGTVRRNCAPNQYGDRPWNCERN
jgi:hypothetical protein